MFFCSVPFYPFYVLRCDTCRSLCVEDIRLQRSLLSSRFLSRRTTLPLVFRRSATLTATDPSAPPSFDRLSSGGGRF